VFHMYGAHTVYLRAGQGGLYSYKIWRIFYHKTCRIFRHNLVGFTNI
jgi:hypothetical protein